MIIKFDEELALKWIEAIESGEYKQAVGALRKVIHTQDRYCCLGVLCNIVDPQGWYPGTNNWIAENGNAQAWHLDMALAKRLGFKDGKGTKMDGTPWKIKSYKFENLAQVNDNGHSFSDVAGLLREYYGLPK